METIKHFITSLFLLLSISLLSTQAFAIQAAQSGVSCKAANLSQALNLGMGHSQSGVINNGTGPFFTVCPFEPADTDTTFSNIRMQVIFPSGGGSMTCIIRGQANGSSPAPSYTFASFTITGTAGVYDSGNPGIPLGITLNPNSIGNITVVCPLSPGYGISWIFLI